ncbi:hypothetical protein Tasa_002_054 [Tanticharoenia sakaeratensis NBRC 103193]|uniref:DUF1800 domain-containing protein n=2 Tax=Tanticharoenia TaxID=444052 RepID=A0A0D6MGM3_9PROT|nr:hypothetical protein Tasa_002_054 [Tanticharoenia sakaeratensis NBRC 103193]
MPPDAIRYGDPDGSEDMMDTQAMTAVDRFGLGRRGTEPLPDDPQGWLRDQLTGPDRIIFPTTLGTSADGLRALHAQRMQKLPGNPLVKPLLDAEASAQLGALLATDQPFRERLVWFWANHFTVSIRQGGTQAVVGPYIREAIRPHVTGRFADMLLAVMRHPAMLLYLDNAGSVGPNSPAGLRSHRGLNENLARECLELHTVSPAAGYAQADVTSFAAILTGWSVDMNATEPGFVFRPRAHEPGPKTLMGRTFPEGEDGGVQALAFLGTHPATYRHIATQLAVHFVSDTPPPSVVAALATALVRSDGDLGAVSRALVTQRAAWMPRTKFRTPWDYTVAALRALDLGARSSEDAAPPDPDHTPGHLLRAAMAFLGQPVWTAPLPNGWSDRAADWAQPADIMARTDWAYRLSAHATNVDPVAIAEAVLGAAAPSRTMTAIHHAGSRQDGLTILFSSPEFQRR